MKIFKSATLQQALPWILTVGGSIGLIASLIISIEKIELLQNPAYRPSCDLDPIISCGSVMASWQANAFGFPNPFIGLVSFGVLIAVGMALFAGGQFKRWFWLGLQAGTVFGLGFVHWLFYQSVYNIQALCPYCMVVWIATITIFWYVLLYNLRAGHIVLPARVSTFVQRHHLDILFVWLLAIAVLILKHFWYFYGDFLR